MSNFARSLCNSITDAVYHWTLRERRRECHRIAFRIAAMGQENGNAQCHLNDAKDALYSAAREFWLEDQR